jgi:DNA excision repair protein ERCC-2
LANTVSAAKLSAVPLRFDESKKLLTVSVRELAEDDGIRRIGFERGESWNRLGLGAELHCQVLQNRCAKNSAYQSEIHLETEIAFDDWNAIVTGRLDGCVQNGNGAWLIEEFKSAYSPHAHVRPFGESFERHRRQLLIYCHLWNLRGNSPVSGALVYVDLASGKEFPFEISYDSTAQQKEIETRLRQLLANWRAEEITRKKKALIAANLPFPHSSPRPGQAKLISAVQQAVRSQENLLAEAPTGSGKTAAGIHPALVEALSTGKQLFFLTAKTLQQKMAADALVAMNSEGGFRTLQLRSKEKMCANDRVICHEDFCPYAKNYAEKMEKSKLLERLRETQTHHEPGAVFDEAKREKVCPFEVQLELASRADAVVADYNYVFDPGVSLNQLDDLENKILVVDEAHNLPERARQIFSPELREEMFRSAVDGLSALTPRRGSHKSPARLFSNRSKNPPHESTARLETIIPLPGGEGVRLQQTILFPDESAASTGNLFDEIRHTFESVASLLKKTTDALNEQSPIAETTPPEKELRKIWKDWEPCFIEYLSWKRENKIAAVEDAVVDCHFALQKFVSTLNLFGPGFSCVVERAGSGIRLALVCLDPARPLAPIFKAASSTIFLSATLSPIETTRRILGLEKTETKSISLPPPFPRENRKILVLPQVRTTFGAREKNFPRIANLVAEMSEAVPGNVLVLFPSYKFLMQVAEFLPKTSACLLTQRPSLPELERQKILRALSSSPRPSPPSDGGEGENGVAPKRSAGLQPALDIERTKAGYKPALRKILLFAVLGGMYAEGVDYPGELLSGVFVVSPALPQVSFERELLRRYFDEQEQAGFAYAYLQPGMTRVIQAAGRLIRSETDRGVIALICQRFLQMPYADFLPKDWFDETPAELTAQNPAKEIASFFQDRSPNKQIWLNTCASE